MKKIGLFFLLAFFVICSSFTSKEKYELKLTEANNINSLYVCHIEVYWHNSTGNYITHYVFNTANSEDCQIALTRIKLELGLIR